jgi:hypothetical protein
MLQFESICCNLTVYVAIWQCMLQFDSVCCNLTVCVAIWQYMLQFDSICCNLTVYVAIWQYMLQFDSICCNLTVYVAIWQYMLQFDSIRCNLTLRAAADLRLRPGSHVSHFLGRARCSDARHRTTLILMCAGIRISLSSDIQRDGFAVTTWTYVIAKRTETSVYEVNTPGFFPNRKYDAAASSTEEMTDVWTGPKSVERAAKRTLQDLLPYVGDSRNHRALLSLLVCRYEYLSCVRKGLTGLLFHKFINKQPWELTNWVTNSVPIS